MCVTSKDLKIRMSKDSGKKEALTKAPRDKEGALITAPREKIEALTTTPRPSEGGIPGPGPKAEKSEEKKKDEGGPSGIFPESILASLHEEIKEEWSKTLQELVRSQIATSGVGTMLHDTEINRRLLWLRLTRFDLQVCLLYTSPSPRDLSTSRMPSSA